MHRMDAWCKKKRECLGIPVFFILKF